MTNDDEQVGRVLGRRRLLLLAGGAALAACSPRRTPVIAASPKQEPGTAAVPASTCVVRPELTEGPFFVDARLDRSDIRLGRDGVPLKLGVVVSQLSSGSCTPVQGATVDVWHCDALGEYSSGDDTFLRGYQTSGADGLASFVTIYPGWYSGRTIHIHFKIRKERYEFTSQMFFDESVTDRVAARAPYNRRGSPNVRNRNDNIFSDDLLLRLEPDGDGYATTFNLALQIS